MQGGDLELLGPIAVGAHVGGARQPGGQQGRGRGSGADRRARGLSFRAMLKPLALLTVLFALLLAAPAGAVIVPGKGMAGAKLGQCIEDVVAKIGEPDKTFGKTEPTGEFVETYTYDKLAIKIRFFRGPGECLVAGEFFTARGQGADGRGRRQAHLAPDPQEEAQAREVRDVPPGQAEDPLLPHRQVRAGQARHRVPDDLQVASRHDQRAGRQRLGLDERRALALARLAGVAAGQVVVDQAHRLHERVDGGGADEAPAARFLAALGSRRREASRGSS